MVQVGMRIQPAKLYTRVKVTKEATFTGGSKREVDIQSDKILTMKLDDGTFPNVIVITGQPGMGKSAGFKHLLEKSLQIQCLPSHKTTVNVKPDKTVNSLPTSSVIPEGLDAFEYVIYTECRNRIICSIDEWLRHFLPNTPKNIGISQNQLKNIILKKNVLVIIDSYEEFNNKSSNLVHEMMDLPSNCRVLISTRPEYTEEVNALIPSHKTKINLVLHGITAKYRQEFIDKVIDMFPDIDDDEKAQAKEKLQIKLSGLQHVLGEHLNTPLTLLLLVLLWIKFPQAFNNLTTLTGLYNELKKQMKQSLIYKLVDTKKMFMNEVKRKVERFLEFLDQKCYECIKRQEFELHPVTVEQLKTKCVDLSLPPELVLPTFLNAKLGMNGTEVVIIYNFFHRRMQAFSAACYITKLLSENQNNSEDISSMLSTGKSENVWLHHQDILQHITGCLSINYNFLMEKYATEITKYVILKEDIDPDGRKYNIDPLLSLVVESQNNTFMCSAVAKWLEVFYIRDMWYEVTDESLSALPHILNYTVPANLDVTVKQSTQNNCHILPAIDCITKKNIKVALFLWDDKEDDDKMIEKFLQSDCSASLVRYGGRLSAGIIRRLGEDLPCLQSLELHLNCEETLPALVETLPHLTCLYHLNVTLHCDVTAVPLPSCLPRLNYSGNNLYLLICTSIPLISTQVHWSADMIQQLIPLSREGNIDGLELLNTQLDDVGIQEFLNSLHSRGINVTDDVFGGVIVYSTVDIITEQLTQFSLHAKKQGLGGFDYAKIPSQ